MPNDPDSSPQHTTGGGFRWEPPTADELQKLMPGYTIEKLLGRGGMGAVYKGVQENLDRVVAIKILPPGVEKEDPSFAERFKNEAKLMAKLMHPAVVGVFDFGTTLGGQLYIAMEFVDGTDIAQMIAEQKKLPPDYALAITAHVCDALAAAHEIGIVHRDIKPANILINMKGQIKVADFGLAKIEEPGSHGLTKTGYAMGTPDYVAPEALALGTSVDGRADLYAVGVMLYQMLTGQIPRGAWQPASVLSPGTDKRFDQIITKAMQYDREARYQSSTELRQDLDVILTVPIVQQEAPAAQKPTPQSRPGVATARPAAGGTAPDGRAKATSVPRHADTPAAPKSKAPLFLGLGAAVAIGIGAFVMLGGKKQDSVTTTSPPSKPASAASSTPKPAASASPKVKPLSSPSLPVSPSSKPAVSKSRPLPVSASSDKFPPGQWVKITNNPDEMKTNGVAYRGPQLLSQDGWLVTSAKPVDLRINELNASKLGVRIVHKLPAKTIMLDLAKSGKGSRRMEWNLEDGTLSLKSPGTGSPDLYRGIHLPNNDADHVELEFVQAAGRYLGRVNGKLAFTVELSPFEEAFPSVYSAEAFRDIEVINLDGLSEAEALKILGVDEKGNDLRQKPAAVASATPAASSPTPSASKASTAPASSSPPLPVPASNASRSDAGGSKSSDKFPPGQWVKVFTTFEDLPESMRRPGAKGEDGWIVPNPQNRLSLAPPEFPNSNNHGIKITYRIESPKLMFSGEVRVRHLGSSGYAMGVVSTSQVSINVVKEIQSTVQRVPLALSPPTEDWKDGTIATLEFFAVGSKLSAWVNGKLVTQVEDSTRNHGKPALLNVMLPFRDIEVINLDGLSEAEALKIIGLDEKGNDLRAAALAAEKQAMAQAKTVGAIAAIPELKALDEQFQTLTAERVTAPFEAEVAKLNAGYLGGLDRKIPEEKAAGHLDGVLALQAEKKLIQGVTASSRQPNGDGRQDAVAPCPLPEDDAKTPASLKALRQIYREAYAKIEADRATNLQALTTPLSARLKQLVAELTQQDRIADAKTVREYREAMEQGDTAAQPVADEPASKMTEEIPITTSVLPAGVLKAAGIFRDEPLDLSTFGDLNGFIQVTCGPMSWAALRADGSVISSNPAINGLKDIESVNYTSQGLAAIPRKKSANIMVTWVSPNTAKELEPSAYGGGKVVDVALGGQGNLIVLKDDHSIRLIGRNFAVSKTLQETKALPDIVAVTSSGHWLAALDHTGRVHVWTWWSATSDANDLPAYSVDTSMMLPGGVAIFDTGGGLRVVAKAGGIEGYAWQNDRTFKRGTPGTLPTNWKRVSGAFLKFVVNADNSWKSVMGTRIPETLDPQLPKGRPVLDMTGLKYGDPVSECVLWIEPPDGGAAPEAAAPPAPATVTKDAFTNSLGMKFVPVKGTDVLFCIHETRYQDYAAYAAEAQGVEGPWKDQSADGYTPTENKEQHPVMKVSWEDAQKFCAWLSKKEGKTYRLPTDEEWSIAVGIGRDEKWKKDTTPATVFKSQTDFPWGDKWSPPKGSGNFSDDSRKAKAPNTTAKYLENYDDGFPTTAPVMSFKPNKLGLYDLEGNVREWVEDWHDNAKARRVLRGGCWYYGFDRAALLSSYRGHALPGNRHSSGGFRCVLVVSGG